MNSGGFTLIELLIVCAIMGFITSVVLLSDRSFSRSILLSEAAHAVASTVRQAQALSYGFHIENENSGTSSYTVFQDVYPASSSCSGDNPELPDAQLGDCQYEPTEGELVKVFHMREGASVTRFCIDDNTVCTTGGGDGLSSLDIVFSHLNSRVSIIGYAPNGGQYFPLVATLYVSSPRGGERCVVIRDNGQIATPQTCP